jgi:GNAT superfamily N-acetyltransferase
MMIDIETINLPERDKIHSFLLRSKYGKFRLWPDASDENVANFLLEQIYEIQNRGRVFIATINGEISVIMIFRELEWDTAHFGFKCAKIDYILTDKTLNKSFIEQSLEKILFEFKKFCTESAIKCVIVSVDSLDSIINFALQKANYKYIVTWVDGILKSSTEIPRVRDGFEIGAIKPEEADRLKEICALSYFKGGRFYLDVNFNRQMVDSMYANLVNYSFANGDFVLVYRDKNKPVGLFIWAKIVTYKSFSNIQVAPARFLIVDPEYRNKKIGYNFFIRSLEYFKDKSDLMTTGLEVNNLPSLNLNVKSGFKLNYSHNVYHWWSEII